MSNFKKNQGVTLIEVIAFITVISIALVGLLRVYNQAVFNGANVDPLTRVRALEIAQAQLDQILARRFDENTPPGGIPACNSTSGAACLGISPESDLDDVGDYHNLAGLGASPYDVSVQVVEAGGDFGLAADQFKRITVTVTTPGSDSVVLSSYKANF